MRTLTLILPFLLFILACNTKAIEPQFQKVENIKVVDLTANKVTINGDAVVYNPNPVSIHMTQIELDVFANEMLVGHVSQTKEVEILKKANFSIPLGVSFNPKELFKDNLLGLLESALSSYAQEKVSLTFQGHAQFRVMDINFKIPINYNDEILLKEE